MYKKYLLCLLAIMPLSTYCYRPDCDVWCCREKQHHKVKEREQELCKAKCYARSKRSLDDDDDEVTGPNIGGSTLRGELGGEGNYFSSLGYPSPSNIISTTTTTNPTTKKKRSKKERKQEKEKKILECLEKCPKLETKIFGCSDECCKMAEKIHSFRNGTTTYQCSTRCCNGRYVTVLDLLDRYDDGRNYMEDIIDCRKTGEECDDEGGYMLLFSNFTSICLRPGELCHVVGGYFNKNDECGELQIPKPYANSISYPPPENDSVSTNPYGAPRGSAGWCNEIDYSNQKK